MRLIATEKRKNHHPIIKKAASLITKTDMRKRIYDIMDRHYDATHSYERWCQKLHARSNLLVPANDNSDRHQERRRGSRQVNKPRHHGVKRQQNDGRGESAQPHQEKYQVGGDDYRSFGESEQ